ncbi:MAG: GNAT family N-acetyltransferase [Erysipelotrichaceae bacterium]|nr:GNAT family N-acetyltransferase [Erysipelotrichaceae bacterium]
MPLFRKRLLSRDLNLSDGEIRLIAIRSSSKQYSFRIYLKDTTVLVGYCDLRLGHTESLYYYGNIGYRILPEYRGHRYAYKACLLLFQIARTLKLDYLLITASPENTPSVKTCERLGGKLLETVDVPSWHPLYSMNERVKKVFRYEICGNNN